MGTYQKTKGVQSYLRMWGSYDPIDIWAKNRLKLVLVVTRGLVVQRCQHKQVT